jgi:membrane-associated phospholipid phosphatase
MEAILQWGLDCIRLIQVCANPPLTMGMRIITELGATVGYLLTISVICWCVSGKKYLQIGTVLLISVWINLVLKFLLDQPRPFFEDYDPTVGMLTEKLGGFPSGHAQNTLVMWMIIASWGRKKRYYGVAAFFCLLVGFSRVYLGLHFPTDVIGGWLIGGMILCGYFIAGRRIETLLASHSPRAAFVSCAALAFIMILYRPSVEMLMPGGILLGLGTGYFLCQRYIGFDASGTFGRISTAKYLTLAARFALGIAGIVLLYGIAGKILAIFNDSDNYQLVVFMLFILLALWISAGAPWLFQFLHLAETDKQNQQDGG